MILSVSVSMYLPGSLNIFSISVSSPTFSFLKVVSSMCWQTEIYIIEIVVITADARVSFSYFSCFVLSFSISLSFFSAFFSVFSLLFFRSDASFRNSFFSFSRPTRNLISSFLISSIFWYCVVCSSKSSKSSALISAAFIAFPIPAPDLLNLFCASCRLILSSSSSAHVFAIWLSIFSFCFSEYLHVWLCAYPLLPVSYRIRNSFFRLQSGRHDRSSVPGC